jgi:hydrogenase expression/formation protein HypC
MCLAIPGKITAMFLQNSMHMAKVDFGGVVRDVCIEAVPDAKIDDYVIVHAGFALNTLSESEAQETLSMLRKMELLDQQATENEKIEG